MCVFVRVHVHVCACLCVRDRFAIALCQNCVVSDCETLVPFTEDRVAGDPTRMLGLMLTIMHSTWDINKPPDLNKLEAMVRAANITHM